MFVIITMTSVTAILRHLAAEGLFILAALDSSLLPTLGAVDVFMYKLWNDLGQ
jgi:hypothetical protein